MQFEDRHVYCLPLVLVIIILFVSKRYKNRKGNTTFMKYFSGVLSLCPNDVRYTTKEGLKIFSSGSENMHSMRTMVRGSSHDGVPHDNYVLMAGQNEHFFELDLTTGSVTEKPSVVCDPSVVVMKKQQHGYLCCGQQTGEVLLYDPDTLKACHTLEAHSSAISDFDVHNNLLVTCGFTERYGHLTVDPYLMVYDIRTLRPFPHVQVPIDPVFVKFMPTYTLRCLVVSQTGQYVLAQPDSIVVDPGIYQLNNQGQPIMDCCVSNTYQSFGFGDSAGFIHIWSDRDETQLLFNHGDKAVVLPDEVPHLDAFDIDDWSIPLTDIPTPYTNEPLLSDWPEHLLKRADRPTPPIDPDILKNMTIRQFVGYAPNPKKRLRNQVAYDLQQDMNGDYNRSPNSPMSRENSVVPKMYRKVDIKYSKYGVEDFNFKHYNQTKFSGLEIHIPNAYCNSMLQVLYFIDILRVGLRNHMCEREFCVACELGFLFYMLDTSEGQTCQASNFLRTFRTLPEASALGLLINDQDQGRKNKSISHTIQNWNRFVLRQLHQDTKRKQEDKNASFKDEKQEGDIEKNGNDQKENDSDVNGSTYDSNDQPKEPSKEADFENPSIIKDLFGMDVMSCRTCKCGNEHDRKVTIFGTDLAYPDRKDADAVYPFTKLLQESIMRKQTTQAWCDKCQKYQTAGQLRKIVSLPDVLAINCQLDHAKDIEFWKKQQELSEPSNQIPVPLHASPPKLCRYGKFCNRPGCKFTHQGREQPQMLKSQNSEDQTNVKSWIPLSFEAIHNLDTLEVELIPCANNEMNEKKEKNDCKEMLNGDSKEEIPPKVSEEKQMLEATGEEKGEETKAGMEDVQANTEVVQTDKEESGLEVEKEKPEDDVPAEDVVLNGDVEDEGNEIIATENGNIKIEEELKENEVDEALLAKKTKYPKYVYKLVSNVCHINDAASGSTLVSHIHVGADYHTRKRDEEKEGWYVFNDFAITPITETEAVTFNMEWKVPSVLIYQRQEIEGKYETEIDTNKDSSILFCDKSLASRQSRFSRNFSPLNSAEVLKEGDIVGVDAEFVTLNQEVHIFLTFFTVLIILKLMGIRMARNIWDLVSK